jgi:hypothetical protein
VRSGGIGPFLADATGPEAQLALSFIVWPGEAPDPRMVDEWLRGRQRSTGARGEERLLTGKAHVADREPLYGTR